VLPAVVVALAQIRREWINFVQGDPLYGVMVYVPWKLTSPERLGALSRQGEGTRPWWQVASNTVLASHFTDH
jgi:hypothetical protein